MQQTDHAPKAEPSPLATEAAAAASRRSGHLVEALLSAELAGALRADLYRLANGLEVLLAHDGRAPIFAYQTWFRVGSRDEDPGRTGLAHLFEHLMFKGTTTYPTGTFDAEMERRGASTNAATWVDWTYYTQSLASEGDNLATVVRLEADRLHNLVLSEETFRSELEVVKNERRMSVDNSVPGQLGEVLSALMFAQHPYRWPTIGSMAHLEAASIADLEAFYRRHYRPDNATIVLCGAIDDAAATLALLAASYGPLRGSGEPRRRLPPEPEQTAPRAHVLVTPVLNPQLAIGFLAPPQSDRAHAGLEMLLTMLTCGDTAWLYDALVTRAKLASEVSGSITPFAQPGQIEFHLLANADVSVDDLLSGTRDVLGAVGQRIDEASLEKARNSLTFDFYDGLHDIESLAETLGHEQTNTGNFARALLRPALWQSITAAELRALAAQTFARSRENVVVAVAERAQAGSVQLMMEASKR